MSNRLSLESNTNIVNFGDKRESFFEAEENVQSELEKCEKIKTKNPEVCIPQLKPSNCNLH